MFLADRWVMGGIPTTFAEPLVWQANLLLSEATTPSQGPPFPWEAITLPTPLGDQLIGRPAHRETTSIGRPPSRRRPYLPAGDSPFLWEAILSSRKQSFPTEGNKFLQESDPSRRKQSFPACRRRPLPQSLPTGGCLLQQKSTFPSPMCRRQLPF